MWQKYSHMWYWYCIMWRWNCQMWEKSKGTTKCDKRIVTCDVEPAQCDDSQMWEKKIREPLNVTKELSYVMLELHNMRIELLNVRKK